MKKTFTPPVSIIVAVKNEEANIGLLIDFLKNQDYPDYEIIIVDDYSTDRTLQLLKAMNGIRILQPPNDLPGKKLALNTGIQAAHWDYIVLTDGDCYSSSTRWLENMVSPMDTFDVVLAYAPLQSDGRFAGNFAEYETWITGMMYLSAARAGYPYMGVGRNIAFTKKRFFDVGGYTHQMEYPSGDDDLLVQAMANGENTAGVLSPEVHVYSSAPSDWTSFFKQKRRHISSSFRYKTSHQIILTMFSASHILFYTLLLTFILQGNIFLLGLWVVKIAIQAGCSWKVSRYWNEMRNWRRIIIFDILFYMYYLIMIFKLWTRKSTTWN
ncbi:MAG TPA: glycosyltransferase [Saprospiraceae bacterium]|nr:glycosyltransferase [Saprospiraceae bacterium]